MNLKLVALFLIVPLLTFVVTMIPDAEAGDGEKACSKKDKSAKSSTYSKGTKMSSKMTKKMSV